MDQVLIAIRIDGDPNAASSARVLVGEGRDQAFFGPWKMRQRSTRNTARRKATDFALEIFRAFRAVQIPCRVVLRSESDGLVAETTIREWSA